jgi:DNA uptake protein ComE-like DNA-binding protein
MNGNTEQIREAGATLLEAQLEENAELRLRLEDLETENVDLRMGVEQLETELREQVKRSDIELAAELKKHEGQLKHRVREVREHYIERLQEEKVKLGRRFDGRVADLRKRIDELEFRLTEPKDRPSPTRSTQPPATSTGRQTTESKTKAERMTPNDAPAAPTKSEVLNVNDASFEELRKLGLSVTQSARLIAYRDLRGGYESLNELDEVPGLPREVRRELKARLAL